MSYGLDSTYAIGWDHRVCQDYSCAGLIALSNKHCPFLVVADGCSGSRHTDIGARLVARAAIVNAGAAAKTDDPATWHRYGTAVAATIKHVATRLSLPPEALDATLLYGIGDGTTFGIGFHGDGCAILRDRTGTLTVVEVVYESNAPRYLSYWLDRGRAARYEQEFPGQVLIRTYAGTAGGFILRSEIRQDVAEPVTMACPENDLSLVILSTDGLGSFTKGGVEPVPLLQIVPEVAGFKGMAGEFLQRRVTRMKATLEKTAIRHYDDIGLAACHLQPEEESADEP